MSQHDNITILDKSHFPFMAVCSNTGISKVDKMLVTKRIELMQVQSPCQAKIHFYKYYRVLQSKTEY